MKIITSEAFSTALNAASPEVKEIIFSTKIYDCVEKFLRDSGQTADASDAILPIGYNVLGLLTIEETVMDLDELGVKNSLRLLGEVKESISKPATLTPTPVTVPDSTTKLADEISETEKSFAALQGIRTMASDIHSLQVPDEPVYRTPSQSEILSRSANTPQTEGGRWETER